MEKIKLGILGATGRMGQEVLTLVRGEYASHFHPEIIEASRTTDPQLLLDRNLIIDFSLPDALEKYIRHALLHKGRLPALVTGTTGLSVEQTQFIELLCKNAPVLSSSNFSIGIQVLLQILEAAAPLFKKLGFDQVQMKEIHHTQKKDAPSGTSLYLERELKKFWPGIPVEIESVREGSVIGFHLLEFLGAGENLTLGHRAVDRSIFARGALEAGLWLIRFQKRPGHYVMSDFLRTYSERIAK